MASENLDKRFELIQETFSNPEFKTTLNFTEFYRSHFIENYEIDKKISPTKLLWIAMWEKMSVKMFALLYKYLSNKQTFAFVNLPLMKILQFSLFSNLLKVGLSVNWDIAASSELIIVH